MKPVRTWILLANGEHARIVLNEGVGQGVSHLRRFDFDKDRGMSSENIPDSPGRVFDRQGPGRHAMEMPTNPNRYDQKHFAEELAGYLDHQLFKNKFDRLIIAASPKMLGDLRAAISDSVTLKLHGEINKDITHQPDSHLSSYLKDLVAI